MGGADSQIYSRVISARFCTSNCQRFSKRGPVMPFLVGPGFVLALASVRFYVIGASGE